MLVPHFAAGWKTNQFNLAGWEISCVSCWEKGTDNFFPAILNNTCHALIAFIKHFSTNWWFGAPSYRLYGFYQSAKAEKFCQIHFIRLYRLLVQLLTAHGFELIGILYTFAIICLHYLLALDVELLRWSL